MNSDKSKKKPGSIHMRIEPGSPEKRQKRLPHADAAPTEKEKPVSRLHTHSSYDIGEMIGEGGFGQVAEADDLNLGRKVALKRLYPDRSNSRKDMQALVEEARITSQLQHPNIVPVYDLNPEGTHAFYTMKRVRGQTLEEILNRIRKDDEEACQEYRLPRLLTVFQKACDAIAFAHHHEVIHRDLKPGNIMVEEFGEVLVMDWGLATRPSGDPLVTSRLIKSSSLVGTPQFLAPELFDGAPPSPITDVYALGGILYMILTLRLPIEGNTVRDIISKARQGAIAPPDSFGPHSSGAISKHLHSGKINQSQEGKSTPTRTAKLPHCPQGQIPHSLSAITMKALSTNPTDRYQSVTELQEDLEAYQDGFATQAEKATLWRHTVLFVQRHKKEIIAWSAILLLLSCILGMTGILLKKRAEEIARWGPSILEHQLTQRSLEQNWIPVEGAFSVKDGILTNIPNPNGDQYILIYGKELHGTVAMEMTGVIPKGSQEGDLSFVWMEKRPDPTPDQSPYRSLYWIQAGAFGNTCCIISRFENGTRHFVDMAPFRLEADREYRLRAEIENHEIRLFIDGQLICQYEHLTPHYSGYIGYYAYYAGKKVSDVAIHARGRPRKIDSMDVPDYCFSQQAYDAAILEYKRLKRSSQVPAEAEEATYKIGLCHLMMDEKEAAFNVWNTLRETGTSFYQSDIDSVEARELASAGQVSEALKLLRPHVASPDLRQQRLARQAWADCASLAPESKAAHYLTFAEDYFPDDFAQARIICHLMVTERHYQDVLDRFSHLPWQIYSASNSLGHPEYLLDTEAVRQTHLLVATYLKMGLFEKVLNAPDCQPGIRASALFQLGRIEECMKLLEEQYPKMLGIHYFEMGNFEAALAAPTMHLTMTLQARYMLGEPADTLMEEYLAQGTKLNDLYKFKSWAAISNHDYASVIADPYASTSYKFLAYHGLLLDAARQKSNTFDDLVATCDLLKIDLNTSGEVHCRYYISPLLKHLHGDSDAMKNSWEDLKQYRYMHHQSTWYASRFMLDEITEEEFRQQPAKWLLEERLNLYKALKAEENNDATALNHWQTLMNTSRKSDLHSVILNQFAEWRIEQWQKLDK